MKKRDVDSPILSVIIPACDEEDHIENCLESLLSQKDVTPSIMEVIVAANSCSDETVPKARALDARFVDRGWRLQVLDIPEAGKINALNRGDAVASGIARAYLDADVVLESQVISQTIAALAKHEAIYVTARLNIAPAHSWVSRRYGAFYARLPFMRAGSAPGAGWFAVNSAGRLRWSLFPQVISDDTYVRWLFLPQERLEVEAGYFWPLVEGFRNLVRVRFRQDAGVRQLCAMYPELKGNEGKPNLRLGEHLRLLLEDPIGYLVYSSVQVFVRCSSQDGSKWMRGR